MHFSSPRISLYFRVSSVFPSDSVKTEKSLHSEHSLVHKTDCLLSENKLAAFSTMSLQFLPLSPSPRLLFLFLENSVCTYMPYTMTDPGVAYIFSPCAVCGTSKNWSIAFLFSVYVCASLHPKHQPPEKFSSLCSL